MPSALRKHASQLSIGKHIGDSHNLSSCCGEMGMSGQEKVPTQEEIEFKSKLKAAKQEVRGFYETPKGDQDPYGKENPC